MASLTLPKRDSLIHLEGNGNYAIDNYYRWPHRFFYRHKLKMIVSMMRKNHIYYNILDFGSGPGIFTEELKKHAIHVTSQDIGDRFNLMSRYSLIVCASVLEFCELDVVLPLLKSNMIKGSEIIVASPMTNKLTRAYFDSIGDGHLRNSHTKIIDAISDFFDVTDKKTWLNLYFCIKAVKS